MPAPSKGPHSAEETLPVASFLRRASNGPLNVTPSPRPPRPLIDRPKPAGCRIPRKKSDTLPLFTQVMHATE